MYGVGGEVRHPPQHGRGEEVMDNTDTEWWRKEQRRHARSRHLSAGMRIVLIGACLSLAWREGPNWVSIATLAALTVVVEMQLWLIKVEWEETMAEWAVTLDAWRNSQETQEQQQEEEEEEKVGQ